MIIPHITLKYILAFQWVQWYRCSNAPLLWVGIMPLETQGTAPACVNSHQIAHLENPISFRIRRSKRKCDHLMKIMLSNKIATPYIKLVCGMVLQVSSVDGGSLRGQILIQRWLWGRQTDQVEPEWRSLEGEFHLPGALGETWNFSGDQAKMYSVKFSSTISSDMSSPFIRSFHSHLCRGLLLRVKHYARHRRQRNGQNRPGFCYHAAFHM